MLSESRTERNQTSLHSFSVEFDRLPQADSRLAGPFLQMMAPTIVDRARQPGAIVLGDTSYAGVATAGTVNVYMQTGECLHPGSRVRKFNNAFTAPPPPANPPQAPTGSFTQGGRVFGCPKPTAFPVCPPYYKRSFFVEPRRQAGKGAHKQTKCACSGTQDANQAAFAGGRRAMSSPPHQANKQLPPQISAPPLQRQLHLVHVRRCLKCHCWAED